MRDEQVPAGEPSTYAIIGIEHAVRAAQLLIGSRLAFEVQADPKDQYSWLFRVDELGDQYMAVVSKHLHPGTWRRLESA